MPRVVAPRRLDIGGVVAVRAPHEVVFTNGCDRHELAALRATYLAGLRFDRAERQPASFEHAAIRVIHRAVALLETIEVQVKGVCVLHEELATTQQPEAGS